MRAPVSYDSARTARVAFATRRLLDNLGPLTAAEALEVLGVSSGLLLARIQPHDRPAGNAILRERCLATLNVAARATINEVAG